MLVKVIIDPRTKSNRLFPSTSHNPWLRSLRHLFDAHHLPSTASSVPLTPLIVIFSVFGWFFFLSSQRWRSLFCFVYILFPGDLTWSYGFKCHQNVNNSQIYIYSPDFYSELQTQLFTVHSTYAWMSNRHLKANMSN